MPIGKKKEAELTAEARRTQSREVPSKTYSELRELGVSAVKYCFDRSVAMSLATFALLVGFAPLAEF
jgi:hypothetical protein